MILQVRDLDPCELSTTRIISGLMAKSKPAQSLMGDDGPMELCRRTLIMGLVGMVVN